MDKIILTGDRPTGRIQRYFDDILTHFLGVLNIVRQCLRIGNHNKYLFILSGILLWGTISCL